MTRRLFGRADLWIAVLLLVCLVLFLLQTGARAGSVATVQLEGKTIASLDLNSDVGKSIWVEGAYPLRVTVTENGVEISESSCPGGQRSRTGPISKSGQSIIGLPGQDVVTIEGEQEWDAVTG